MDLIKTKEFGEIPLIQMEGIRHVLLIDRHSEKDTAERLIQELGERLDVDAIGIIYYETGHRFVTPLVWVRATDTRIWESSCGSGSVALAAYLERDIRENWAHSFKEPVGTLKVEGMDGAIYLGGIVNLSATIKTEIP